MSIERLLTRVTPLLRSEWTALRGGGILSRGPGCLVFRTPGNPEFHFGNVLWLERAPRPGDETRLPELFRRLFPPKVRHVALLWDGEAASHAVLESFRRLGFRHEINLGLKLERYRPARRANRGLKIELVRGSRAWKELGDFQIELRRDNARRHRFIRRLYADYRRLSESGGGDYYVARRHGRIIGKLGLYHHGGIGRFQQVETAASHRRRGVCTTLMDFALRRAFGELGLRRVIIAADPKGKAIRIYRGAGFRRFTRADDLVLSPRGYAS